MRDFLYKLTLALTLYVLFWLFLVYYPNFSQPIRYLTMSTLLNVAWSIIIFLRILILFAKDKFSNLKWFVSILELITILWNFNGVFILSLSYILVFVAFSGGLILIPFIALPIIIFLIRRTKINERHKQNSSNN